MARAGCNSPHLAAIVLALASSASATCKDCLYARSVVYIAGRDQEGRGSVTQYNSACIVCLVVAWYMLRNDPLIV